MNNNLEKRVDIHACVAWVTGFSQCLEMNNGFFTDIWEIAACMKRRAGWNDCNLHCGQIGSVHYKYWNAGGDCDTTAQVKTIAGAIDAVFKNESGKWLCNTYCITMRHGGTWTGHLKISPISVCAGGCPQYDILRCYDAGCGSLEGSHHCQGNWPMNRSIQCIHLEYQYSKVSSWRSF